MRHAVAVAHADRTFTAAARRDACPDEVQPYAALVLTDVLWASLPDHVLQTCYTAAWYFFERATQEVLQRKEYGHIPLPSSSTTGWQERADACAILGIPDAAADHISVYIQQYVATHVSGAAAHKLGVLRCANYITQLLSTLLCRTTLRQRSGSAFMQAPRLLDWVVIVSTWIRCSAICIRTGGVNLSCSSYSRDTSHLHSHVHSDVLTKYTPGPRLLCHRRVCRSPPQPPCPTTACCRTRASRAASHPDLQQFRCCNHAFVKLLHITWSLLKGATAGTATHDPRTVDMKSMWMESITADVTSASRPPHDGFARTVRFRSAMTSCQFIGGSSLCTGGTAPVSAMHCIVARHHHLLQPMSQLLKSDRKRVFHCPSDIAGTEPQSS